MSKYLLIVIASVAILSTACTSTFLVSKDGKGYFWGSDSNAIYRMLCDSGDLKKILSDTRFSEAMKNDLYRYNCSTDRSGERVKQIYASMTPEQRKELRNAFKNNGYDINYLPC
ncbi:MAG: hypothetical protein OHK0032_01480 [Thermodesulfovibrionales bacterium]